MKKVSVQKFQHQRYISRRKTQPVDIPSENQNFKLTFNRFSCLDQKQNDTQINKPELRSTRKRNTGLSNCNQNQQILLRNMLESNKRKRSEILQSLINTNINFLKKNTPKSQTLTKIKTEQSQPRRQFQCSARHKGHQKNQNFLKLNELQSFRHSEDNWVTERKRPLAKLSHQSSQLLRNSFNKRIKQLKFRKYLLKQEVEQKKLFLMQGYGSTLKGQKHEQNQDSVYFSQGIYVLCDGHGSYGKHVSSFIAQIIHNSLKQCLSENKIDETIILQTYRKADLDLNNSNFDTSFSGCTCVAVIRYEKSLFCINLGDSKAIMDKGCQIIQLSKSHKPDFPSEKQRIQNYGGVVRGTQIGKDKFVGPMRIWAPGKNSWGPGLALSRAFGDKAARKFGVISIPQVTQIKLTSDDQFIVIGSDGLFDFFDDHEIVNFVHKCLKDKNIPKSQIAHSLVKEARKKWVSNADDISCILIFL